MIKNSQWGIRKLKNASEKSAYKEFVIEREKSRRDIDTQLDRIAGGFQKNESSEESHELEMDGYRNTGGGGEY